MSNYKVELERTEKQDLEIKKHISDVKDIVKGKVNKDVNGLNSIKDLLENETLGGYIVDDMIDYKNLEKIIEINDKGKYSNILDKKYDSGLHASILSDDEYLITGGMDGYLHKILSNGLVKWSTFIHKATQTEHAIRPIVTDSLHNIYAFSYGGVNKVSSLGEKVLEIHNQIGTISMTIDDKDCIYTTGVRNCSINKLSSSGEKLYEKDLSKDGRFYFVGICFVGEYVYALTNYGHIYKIDEELNIVFINEENVSGSVNPTKYKCMKYNDGALFIIDEYGTILKCNLKGEKITKKEINTSIVSIDFDNDNYMYVAGTVLIKLDSNFNEIYKYNTIYKNFTSVSSTRDGDFYAVTTQGYVILNEIYKKITGYKVLKVERG